MPLQFHEHQSIRYYDSWRPTKQGCHGARHDYYVLSVYRSGRAAMWMDQELRCEAGDLMLIPAGMQHRMQEASGDVALSGVGFFATPELARSLSGDLKAPASYMTPFERIRSGALPIGRIPSGRQAFFESVLNEIARESEDPSPEAAVAAEHLLSLLLLESGRVFRPLHAESSARPRGDTPVARALSFIEEHCLRPISLADVAESVGRSPAHLTTAVRAATGKPVLAWILAGRMHEARRRLLYTDEDIEAIAEHVGYLDPTHFARLFRREHSLTPAAWRKNARNQTIERSAGPAERSSLA